MVVSDAAPVKRVVEGSYGSILLPKIKSGSECKPLNSLPGDCKINQSNSIDF
jgi:hypothetical protein